MPLHGAAVLTLAAAPGWDIPVRMIVATVLIFSLTELAPLLGAQLSGLAATYPVFAAVLAAFAHRARGRSAANRGAARPLGRPLRLRRVFRRVGCDDGAPRHCPRSPRRLPLPLHPAVPRTALRR